MIILLQLPWSYCQPEWGLWLLVGSTPCVILFIRCFIILLCSLTSFCCFVLLLRSLAAFSCFILSLAFDLFFRYAVDWLASFLYYLNSFFCWFLAFENYFSNTCYLLLMQAFSNWFVLSLASFSCFVLLLRSLASFSCFVHLIRSRSCFILSLASWLYSLASFGHLPFLKMNLLTPANFFL